MNKDELKKAIEMMDKYILNLMNGHQNVMLTMAQSKELDEMIEEKQAERDKLKKLLENA